MARKSQAAPLWWTPPEEVVCPMCERVIPPDQQDEHHLVPRLKGGKETSTLHRICHKQIHALFTEAELAREYNNVEALLSHPEILKFVRWVKTKPPGFCEKARMSHRKR